MWPTDLCALYELRHGLDPFAPEYIACYAAVIGAVVAVVILRKRAPWLAAAAAVYAVSVGPVLGLVQSGDQFMADRYSYIACMAWSALAAGWVGAMPARTKQGVRASAIAALAVLTVSAAGMSVSTRAQERTWSDAGTLWKHAWQSGPTRMMPHVNYGLSRETRARALAQQGRAGEAEPLFEEALDHYRIATRLKPTDGRGWYPLGNALKRKRDFAGAEAAYRESARYLPQAYMPLVNLGNMLIDTLNRPDEAMEAYRAAVEAVEHPRPGSQPSAMPYLALGTGLKKRGDMEGARAAFARALEMAGPYHDPETAKEARLQLAAMATPK